MFEANRVLHAVGIAKTKPGIPITHFLILGDKTRFEGLLLRAEMFESLLPTQTGTKAIKKSVVFCDL